MAKHSANTFPADSGRISSYAETLSYLYTRLPMFTRVGASAYKADLVNTTEFCDRLGNPQRKFKSIHIGGTNGKGSTSHILAAILQTAGYKTGLYTSPHLKDFRERIRINGKMISKNNIVQFVHDRRNDIEQIDPSFFEATVAMAFHHFAIQGVDIAVIEVGLGGRLDSTNVIRPVLSVITNISYDHMNILGDTLPEIAVEKAGIIKPGIPVVIGQKQDEIAEVFIRKAEESKSELVFASDEWDIRKSEGGSPNQEMLTVEINKINPSTLPEQQEGLPYSDFTTLQLDLAGTYQLKNLATVLSIVEQLRRQDFDISDEHIKTALKQVKHLTGLMGRWQILKEKPLVICDTGHNEDGIREVLKNIEATPYEKLHLVIGLVKDKDISKILQILPKQATYYFCQPDIPRAKPADELKLEAQSFGLFGNSYDTIQAALKQAEANSSENDLIFVGGSTFVVAEVV